MTLARSSRGETHWVFPCVSRLSLSLVGVDQAPWTQPRHDFGQAGVGDGEASLASAKHAEVADHLLIHIPGTMHHDRPRECVAVGWVQSIEPQRMTMRTHIASTGFKGSGGGRVGAGLIGKALEPSRMRRVGAAAMGNPMRLHAAIGEVHQVESRCARRQREVSDPDKVSVADAVVMSLQSVERALKQAGRHLTVNTVCSRRSEPSPCRHGSNPGKRKIDKKTA
jgi:hypothetical protein